MKANELRIGNLVEYKITDDLDERIEWWEVSEIDSEDLKIIDDDDDYRPIPLTEEWLKKLGFELKYGCFLLSTNRGTILIEEDLAQISSVISHDGFMAPCKYVHQLQNLYFALTGSELTVA